MGMTIDKTIEFFNGLECHTPQAKDARDTAISTMRKYQKIQEIVKNTQQLCSYGSAFIDIREVIEDGKID